MQIFVITIVRGGVESRERIVGMVRSGRKSVY